MISINNKENIHLISQTRFIILCILTFGIYQTWWIYKSWRFFNYKDKLETNSAIRTIFSIFYLIPLFQRIKVYSKEHSLRTTYSSLVQYIGFVGLSFLSLNENLWLASMFSFIFLIRPFNILNIAISNDKNYQTKKESQFNSRQWLILAIGISFWSIFLIGLLLTIQESSNDYIINMNQEEIENLLNEANN